MRNLVLSTCCLLFMCMQASAKEYKVSTPGEFKKAAEKAAPGDAIVIADGNYSGWELIVPANGVIIKAQTAGKVVFSGEVQKPVFQLTGSNTEISGLAFTACTLLKGGVLIELKAAKHCRVHDCSFSKNVVKAQFTPIVIVSGNGEYNRVDHCTFTSNVDNQEVQVKVTQNDMPLYTLIDHNEFKDKAKVSWKVFNGGECVQVGQDPVLLGTKYPRTTVRNNRFIHCDGEPEVISNKSSGNTYSNNYFEDCKGELVMRGGHECVIDSNTFKGGTGGIRVNGTGHTITNNVLSGLPTGIRLMYGMAKSKTEIGFYIAASDCIIQHNRISDCNTAIFVGDSKNADWKGKFDTLRYPSRTMQDVAPYNNTITDNVIKNVKEAVLYNEH